jgi:hypothetical protein
VRPVIDLSAATLKIFPVRNSALQVTSSRLSIFFEFPRKFSANAMAKVLLYR